MADVVGAVGAADGGVVTAVEPLAVACVIVASTFAVVTVVAVSKQIFVSFVAVLAAAVVGQLAVAVDEIEPVASYTDDAVNTFAIGPRAVVRC